MERVNERWHPSDSGIHTIVGLLTEFLSPGANQHLVRAEDKISVLQ